MWRNGFSFQRGVRFRTIAVSDGTGMLVGAGAMHSCVGGLRKSMLDRILKQTLCTATLAASLVATGCGASQTPSAAQDELPASAPRFLTGTIIELPDSSEATINPPGQIESPPIAVSPSYAPAIEIERVTPPPRRFPAQPSASSTIDAGVRPVAAAEASPIETMLSAPPTAETASEAMPQPRLPAPKPLVRTPRMVAVIQQAEEHNHQGIALASRGASFSARAEFIQALQSISQGLDSETGSADYGRALAVGMRALEEADDFVPRRARLGGEIDVAMLVRASSYARAA